MQGKEMRLGVNIDHVATLRQARRTLYPDLVAAARCCERAGADGITIHLREDRRHIQDADVVDLRRSINGILNLEMACHPEVLAVAIDVGPDEACLVPERREELTTEGGLDVAGQRTEVAPVVTRLRERGALVSLFIDPDPVQVQASADIGAACVELHTGRYCELSGTDAEDEVRRLRQAAELAANLGLQVNAGHGLTEANVAAVAAIPQVDTLNVGHSIVCRALFVGLEAAVRGMRAAMEAGRRGA